jgi:hypothetical protein
MIIFSNAHHVQDKSRTVMLNILRLLRLIEIELSLPKVQDENRHDTHWYKVEEMPMGKGSSLEHLTILSLQPQATNRFCPRGGETVPGCFQVISDTVDTTD